MRLLIDENAALQLGKERYREFVRHMKRSLSHSRSNQVMEDESLDPAANTK